MWSAALPYYNEYNYCSIARAKLNRSKIFQMLLLKYDRAGCIYAVSRVARFLHWGGTRQPNKLVIPK